jgi:hypothetical protein
MALSIHDSCYNMATSSDHRVPNTDPCEIHISSSDLKSELGRFHSYGNDDSYDDDDDAKCILAVVYFLKTNIWSNRSSAHSAKTEINAITHGTR